MFRFPKLANFKSFQEGRASQGCEQWLPVLLKCTDGILELLPHDDQYPSESEKVLKGLINSSTGTVSLTKVPYTIEEWLCNNSHGSNFNRISHKFGDSLSYRVTSNVSLPQGHCLPVTDPARIQELSQELKQQL